MSALPPPTGPPAPHAPCFERATTASSAKNTAAIALTTRPRSRETIMAPTILTPIAADAKAAEPLGDVR
jgi:hypothetical protein